MALRITLLLWLLRPAGTFSVSTDPAPVTALLGSNVLLKCSFLVDPRAAGGQDGQLRVAWFFQGRTLLELDGIPVTTRKGAELFALELPQGNASLLLRHITLADQGPYCCSVHYGGQSGEGRVHLQVAALPQPVVPSTVVEMHKDSVLVCCVSGFYPQDIRVSWLQDGQNLKATFITDTRQEHKKETFSLVAVYRFTPTAQDLGALFSCQAWHPLLNQSRQADVYISFSGPEGDGRLQPELRILLWVLRGALLLAMALGGCFLLQEKVWAEAPRRTPGSLERKALLKDPERNQPAGTSRVVVPATVPPSPGTDSPCYQHN